MTVELRNISKNYGPTVALKNINLRLEEGQFLTLLGPTGCGKSTLLRVIAGFVQPTAGEVVIGGEVINQVPPNRRQIGLLFQNYALFPHMTVEDNVAFGLRVRGLSKSDIAAKVNAMLPLVGIEHLRKRYPTQISGGQQQRTALARTLAIEPRVLLLDEPLAALDRQLKLEMQVELKKLVSRLGITTICVSHDQDEALTMSDRIALLQGGEVKQFGAPLELYDRPASTFAAGFLGRSNLIQGTIDTHDGQACLRSENFRFPLQHCALSPGTSATLMLRPEHLTIHTEPGAGRLSGTVLFVTQFGSSMQYEVALEDGPTFLVTVARDRDMVPIANGARVWVEPAGPNVYQLIQN